MFLCGFAGMHILRDTPYDVKVGENLKCASTFYCFNSASNEACVASFTKVPHFQAKDDTPLCGGVV